MDVVGAPSWKGITFAAEVVEDPLLAGCTMTCVAVIVVLSVVPSTSAVLPLVTELADADFVPFSYVVDDFSLTVTFSPADVNNAKPELDTLLTDGDGPGEFAREHGLILSVGPIVGTGVLPPCANALSGACERPERFL